MVFLQVRREDTDESSISAEDVGLIHVTINRVCPLFARTVRQF
jgi:hypothetical protein